MEKGQSDKRRQAFLRLWTESSAELPRIALGLCALAVNAATNLSFPMLLGQAVDLASTSSDADYLSFLLRAGCVFGFT
jgi:hypothetical protein